MANPAKRKLPDPSATTLEEPAPLKVMLAPLPANPTEPTMLNVSVKLIPDRLALLTLTCWLAGVNVMLLLLGVMV